jgi:hypothetical protein
MNTEKQYFPNGDFTIVKKVNMNTWEVYNSDDELIDRVINNNGVISHDVI